MFKRFTAFLLALLVLTLWLIILLWREEPSPPLFSVRQTETVYRLSQELSGIWHRYDSPAEAWREENRLSPDDKPLGLFGRLFARPDVVLPSGADVHVVARQFSVSEKWASRSAQLVLESFSGQARIYLNGVRSENLVGDTESYGNGVAFTVEATRLLFDRPNILIIELSSPPLRRAMPLGAIWPWREHITGRIHLDSVPETIIAPETIAFDWRDADSLFVATGELLRYRFAGNDPWTVTGVLLAADGTEAARAVVRLEATANYGEKFVLEFPLASPRSWQPDDPYLYLLTLQVANSRGEQDSVQMPVGVAKADTGDGLWRINGQAVPVRGLYLSEKDEFALRAGDLPDGWLAEQKAAGYNVVCFYESFPDEIWFYAADRVGIGLWTALPPRLSAAGPPPATDFQPMLDMAARHASHWAWTAGAFLPPGAASERYLRDLSAALGGKALYRAIAWDEPLRVDGVFTLNLLRPLAGSWGELAGASAREEADTVALTAWPARAVAIAWCVLLLLAGLQNIRAKHWRFQDLGKRPRRAMRESCFWRYAAFFLRMATIAGSWLLLFYRLPLWRLTFVPYDFAWVADLRRQPFLLLWATAAAAFAVARLIQVGIGARAFAAEPEAMGLVCWLERRYALLPLTGIAWVMVTFGWPLYLPFAVYYGLELLLWPLRLRDVRKAGGSNFLLLVFPLTVALIFIIIVVSQGAVYSDYFLRR
ncbi:MAG: hypothetical protein LBS10_04300 [Gracilibacteraceae bacterium]|jgi:hypothetical protein|nr:hypothetical protein [Gracilibacteraceae bacterium]